MLTSSSFMTSTSSLSTISNISTDLEILYEEDENEEEENEKVEIVGENSTDHLTKIVQKSCKLEIKFIWYAKIYLTFLVFFVCFNSNQFEAKISDLKVMQIFSIL